MRVPVIWINRRGEKLESGAKKPTAEVKNLRDAAKKLDKASVTAEVLGGTKGPKIVIQKFKNKTGYKKRQGHRQKYTQVKITDIKA